MSRKHLSYTAHSTERTSGERYENRYGGSTEDVGTTIFSANLTGMPTITDSAEVQTVFAGRVPLMLIDANDHVPPQRRHSASIIDLTDPSPRVVREGSVKADELRKELRDLQLGELVAAPNVPRV